MNVLVLIYVVSAVLAALAVIAAGAVIVMRFARQRRHTRTARIRASLLPEMFAAADSGHASDGLIERLRRNPAIARDLLAEFAEVVRGSSRDDLLRLARASGLDAWLHAQLQSRRLEDCRRAAELLRLFDDPDTVKALRKALDDARSAVRLTAALALAELGRTPPLVVLLPSLVTGTEERSMLLRRLFGRIVQRDADEVMRVAAGQIGGPAFRPLAIEALGTAGRTEAAPALRAMAFDDDLQVRASVLSALANLGDPSSKDVIGVLLTDRAWQVRVRAIEAARRLTLLEFVPELTARLDDEVWWVRFRAGEALIALGDAGICALRALAEAGSGRTRRMASIVMAERGIA